MNEQKEIKSDILGRYISPGKIEKAPEGFTGRVMTRISPEKLPVSSRNHFLSVYKVPLISVVISLVLIIGAVIASSTGKESSFAPALKPLFDLVKVLPKFDFGKMTGITIPVWSVYIMVGLFFLFVFDLALDTFFNRERKKGRV